MNPQRRNRSPINVWPGYVDALSALLMLVIFMLMVYLVTQLFLSQTVSDRDAELASLSNRLNEITRLLGLEEERAQALTSELATVRGEFALSVARAETLSAERDALREQVSADRETIETLLGTQASLQQDIVALREMRARLEQEIATLASAVATRDTRIGVLDGEISSLEQQLGNLRDRSLALEAELADERERTLLSQREIDTQQLRIQDLVLIVQQAESALESEQTLTVAQRVQIQRLSEQVDSLQDQLRAISAALRLQESLTAERDTELAELGARLNALLAERVNELERYQSDFFRRLRDVLEDNENVRIVGDRFLLPSELFFASGLADIGPEGQAELNKLAVLLLDLVDTIPADVDWIMRVDGHTDRVPINRPSFPSNWELSAARAVSVVRYLAAQGVPEERLAAAGFGEFHPLDEGTSPEALQRNRRIEIKLTDR
ncbi:OmpA family protein [Salinispirillum sp. LH 10-3-1]|uniref:OmpA family protein n=1 Tax=Salinispirillum sp. LH 10-3-1 TaxID=2952525 RepID=A0AB38YBI0_9GAMM